MAKVRVRGGPRASRHARGFKITGTVVRGVYEGLSSKGEFKACVRLGYRGHACDWGKNPRAAIANALTAYARVLRKRRGAFAGLHRR